MKTWNVRLPALLALTALLLAAAPAAAGTASQERAAWLLERGAMMDLDPGGGRFFQDEIGGSREIREPATVKDTGRATRNVGLKVLASAVLPGSGEALMGHKRGYVLMAADIFAWTQVIKNQNDGDDLKDQYYAFADAHYDDRRLVQAYTSSTVNPYPDLGDDWIERRVGTAAIGWGYFQDESGQGIVINSIEELGNLPLYVSKEDDRREYYENLGKWDQFVFGWDDFRRPEAVNETPPTYRLSDLSQPGVSRNREKYRDMRRESNDAYKARDRWLYVNIGLRIFSVIETAWLGGLLGGEDEAHARVGGHPVRIVAAAHGPYRGHVGAKVWF